MIDLFTMQHYKQMVKLVILGIYCDAFFYFVDIKRKFSFRNARCHILLYTRLYSVDIRGKFLFWPTRSHNLRCTFLISEENSHFPMEPHFVFL